MLIIPVRGSHARSSAASECITGARHGTAAAVSKAPRGRSLLKYDQSARPQYPRAVRAPSMHNTTGPGTRHIGIDISRTRSPLTVFTARYPRCIRSPAGPARGAYPIGSISDVDCRCPWLSDHVRLQACSSGGLDAPEPRACSTCAISQPEGPDRGYLHCDVNSRDPPSSSCSATCLLEPPPAYRERALLLQCWLCIGYAVTATPNPVSSLLDQSLGLG